MALQKRYQNGDDHGSRGLDSRLEMNPFPAVPSRLSPVGERIIKFRPYLTGVEAYYVWKYRPKGGTREDPHTEEEVKVKRLIGCLKLSPLWSMADKRKSEAIDYSANALASLLPPSWWQALFVPVPPSKPVEDETFDPRMLRLLKAVRPPLSVADILTQSVAMRSTAKGLLPWHRALMMRCAPLTNDRPRAVVLVDDVLATGCHFRASELLIQAVWPGIDVIGVFLACSIPLAFP